MGEAQTIILAKQKGEGIVLMDQAGARSVAKQLGLRPRETMFATLLAIRRRLMAKEDSKKMLDALVDARFHVSAQIYRGASKAIESS